MLKDVKWAEDGTYRPGEINSPDVFFEDCLHNSNEFDLQLGYFSSATISILADGFASFISRGGKMRLIINNIVSDEDKTAIKKGVIGDIIDCINLDDFNTLLKTFDEYEQQFFDCLAYMIQQKRIDIRIIKPKNSIGIAHTKSGQFRDGDSITSFTGSANFTIGGLFNNLEEVKIDRSDSIDTMVQKRIQNQRIEFDSIMNQEKANIEYLSPDNLVSAVVSNYGDKDIEELLDVENKLKEVKRKRKATQKNFIVADDFGLQPSFPYPSGPRDYQQTAFENWAKNNQKGLFAMATGTGKTITSLNCLLEIYKRKGYYKAIILVPTITLVDQWEIECLKFNFNNIIKVFSKNSNWKEDFDLVSFNEKHHKEGTPGPSYIIITTYASYIKPKVFNQLNDLSRTQLLLIADECHNMGSASLLKKLKEIPYGRRIGLSATPERQFDDEGNSKIRSFFGAEEQYTFEYSMQEAIENGVLCKYYYYPHLIRLTNDEMEQYVEISHQIVKYFNFSKEKFDHSDDKLKRLLLKRKRIIHKAKNKIASFKSIIKESFEQKGTLKYTLVYVPEGTKPDYLDSSNYADQDDIEEFDEISDHLIDEYTKIVMQVNKRVTVRKFVAGQKDREEVLHDFASGKLQVLTSMKCLDEGVDVPRSELAIFCSSTGNPRQFIQRRGRILRTHKDKKFAVIHDLVVAPEVNANSDSYKMEQLLLKGELNRVRNFALLSENPTQPDIELREVMDYYGLNLYNNDYIL